MMINTQGTTTFCSFFGPGVLLVLGTIFGTWIAWTVNPSPTLVKVALAPLLAAPKALKKFVPGCDDAGVWQC
jgi:hypothetical protein